MLLLSLLLQASAAPTVPPDIQLSIHATAKSVTVDQKGRAKLKVFAESDAGSVIVAKASPVEREARNVTVNIDAEARIADPDVVAPR